MQDANNRDVIWRIIDECIKSEGVKAVSYLAPVCKFFREYCRQKYTREIRITRFYELCKKIAWYPRRCVDDRPHQRGMGLNMARAWKFMRREYRVGKRVRMDCYGSFSGSEISLSIGGLNENTRYRRKRDMLGHLRLLVEDLQEMKTRRWISSACLFVSFDKERRDEAIEFLKEPLMAKHAHRMVDGPTVSFTPPFGKSGFVLSVDEERKPISRPFVKSGFVLYISQPHEWWNVSTRYGFFGHDKRDWATT
jgi:hypothetical protein